MNKATLIGVDAGSSKSGIIIITEKGIREGNNIPNDNVLDYIASESCKCNKLYVVLEDVRPYNMRISDGIIQTIKFIGELEYRLRSANIPFELIPRWQVKQWVFLQFRTMAEPEIIKNMDRQSNRKIKAGDITEKKERKPSFVWVDDRIVQKAMRIHWSINKPLVGKRTPFNLKDHSWQALGLASYYIALYNLTFLWKKANV